MTDEPEPTADPADKYHARSFELPDGSRVTAVLTFEGAVMYSDADLIKMFEKVARENPAD